MDVLEHWGTHCGCSAVLSPSCRRSDQVYMPSIVTVNSRKVRNAVAEGCTQCGGVGCFITASWLQLQAHMAEGIRLSSILGTVGYGGRND